VYFALPPHPPVNAKETSMELFILAGLSLCVLFFLAMACVHLLGMEKKVVDVVQLTEKNVTRLYKGV
jgi:hypothetical protein